jgi:hypothetical protein
MKLIIKQLGIIIGVFSITLWVQQMDDKKYNKNRIDFYDKYKFPLLMSAIIGLLINVPELIMKINTKLKLFILLLINFIYGASTLQIIDLILTHSRGKHKYHLQRYSSIPRISRVLFATVCWYNKWTR